MLNYEDPKTSALLSLLKFGLPFSHKIPPRILKEMTYYLEEVSPLLINKIHFGEPLPGILFVQYGCLQLDVQCWDKEVTLEILARNSSLGFSHNSMT